MLQIRDLNQYYDQSHILWDLSLTAEAGQCTCVMGRNGVGKTSLLKAIMGLVPVRSGEVLFEGESLIGKSAEYRARAGIGYVPQGRMIFPQLSVQENLLCHSVQGVQRKFPIWSGPCSRCCARCCTDAGETFQGGSSSNWPLAAPWSWIRSC